MLPDPKDADRDVWLDNWLHIISIAYSRWNGFLDCIMENMALYLSLCEDLVSIDLLLMLIRKLYSRSFYGMVLDVRIMVMLKFRKERKGKVMRCVQRRSYVLWVWIFIDIFLIIYKHVLLVCCNLLKRF